MQIFLSYKETGLPRDSLTKELNYIKNIIEKTGNNVYIYYFDKKQENNPKKLMNKIKQKINKSDLIIGYVNYIEKSEGQLLELGISEGLGKKILLLVDKKIEKNYSLIYGLNSDILYYNNITEIEKLLTNYLTGK